MITIDFEDLILLREALRDHHVGRDSSARLMALYERVTSLPLQRDVSFDIRQTSDRASIVAFLHAKADQLEDSIETMARTNTGSTTTAARLQVEAANARAFAAQIERGDDRSFSR